MEQEQRTLSLTVRSSSLLPWPESMSTEGRMHTGGTGMWVISRNSGLSAMSSRMQSSAVMAENRDSTRSGFRSSATCRGIAGMHQSNSALLLLWVHTGRQGKGPVKMAGKSNMRLPNRQTHPATAATSDLKIYALETTTTGLNRANVLGSAVSRQASKAVGMQHLVHMWPHLLVVLDSLLKLCHILLMRSIVGLWIVLVMHVFQAACDLSAAQYQTSYFMCLHIGVYPDPQAESRAADFWSDLHETNAEHQAAGQCISPELCVTCSCSLVAAAQQLT